MNDAKDVFKELYGMIAQSAPPFSIAIAFWDGELIQNGRHPKATLHLKSEESAREILAQGFLGFGDAYVLGEVEVEGDLRELLHVGLALGFGARRLPLRQKLSFFSAHLKTRGTRRHALSNVSRHYDLGNDFYALYLDDTMTYYQPVRGL